MKIEQQNRRDEDGGEPRQCQHSAALTDDGPQRGKETDSQNDGAENPHAGEKRCHRIGVAGGAALLDGLQNLADRFAIVIGGATDRARFFDRLERRSFRTRPCIERRFVKSGRSGRTRRRRIVAHRASVAVGGFTNVQGFLNRRKRYLGRVFDLLGIVRHVSLSPLTLLFTHAEKVLRENPPQAQTDVITRAAPKRVHSGRLVHWVPRISYWLGRVNEMVTFNTILIIVNRVPR